MNFLWKAEIDGRVLCVFITIENNDRVLNLITVWYQITDSYTHYKIRRHEWCSLINDSSRFIVSASGCGCGIEK